MVCPACGTENETGRKFCGECGTPLALSCGACGSPNPPGVKFCGECGAALAGQASPVAAPSPAAERRLVSVLFADLVGFTTLSESRDAEDTRELLSQYFETARTVIERYGGTVEKFIGDAVMAVWGAPVANEDDAERAVRAALELVAAVPELGPGLAARAGVLTGEAAVTLGAQGEGMVAGDLVNTASRIQSAAEPGTVLVGESTKRATEAAIAYEDAGTHELKGKAESAILFRAVRVTAGVGGALKSEGAEPPFVGRDRELRLVKELFHASAEERKAHLVSVLGIAGIGKSRLSWEFFKYMDGLADLVWWHRGRCLAYGEGVAYWALAEMVRMRATIVEGEEPSSAREKLRRAVELYVPAPDDRSWIEARLAHLLGLEEHHFDRQDLFAGWRLFFERLAESQPVAMVFEDMQWADASLLEFVEYLLEWSRSHPIYVLCLARPELQERHPDFGRSSRNATTLSLEPLDPRAMEELLGGFVPGLPEGMRRQILERAEGIPLYAVETVRMLLDRGLLVREGDAYRPTGPVEPLDVPETLHALLAARLDGLSAEERRLLQDASVLGKTFSTQAIAAVTGLPEAELDTLLSGLVRKEVLGLQHDPRSPDRGQYGFLQDLLRQVAYETVGRADRKTRHLAAAAHLESAFGSGDQEIVEVIASHYVAAYDAAPEAEDAVEIRRRAADMLARAGERATSVAANEEGMRYYVRAAALAEEPLVEAGLLEKAGSAGLTAGLLEEAEEHLERALAVLTGEGETHAAARVSARLGEVLYARGRLVEAIERMEGSLEVLGGDEPDADVAALAAQLARLQYLAGNRAATLERVELALETGEALRLPEVVSQALVTKGLLLLRRPNESMALIQQALKLALDHDLASAALRAYWNLQVVLDSCDRYDLSTQISRDGLALARRRGDKPWEERFYGGLIEALYVTGEWGEALERVSEQLPAELHWYAYEPLARIHVARGELAEAEQALQLLLETSGQEDTQMQATVATTGAVVLRALGRSAEALPKAEEAMRTQREFHNAAALANAFVDACEAAFELGDETLVEQLMAQCDELPPAERTQFLEAQLGRLGARLASRRNEPERAEAGLKAAAALFRELGMPFWLAVGELEHGEWLVGKGRAEEAEPLLAEAAEIFERLDATPWLDRLENAQTTTGVPA